VTLLSSSGGSTINLQYRSASILFLSASSVIVDGAV
jgi:hypothetical protein